MTVSALVFGISSCLPKPDFATNRTPLCASVKLRKNCSYWDLFWGCLVTSASRAGKWGRQRVGEILPELPCNQSGEKCPFSSCPPSFKMLLMQGNIKLVNLVRWAKGCLIPHRFQQFNVLNIVTADLNSEIVILTLSSLLYWDFTH